MQLEFNPAKVKSYRLIGYENRMLAAEDFDNDKKDAGEMGAGTTVTALYELIPADGTGRGHDLKYQQSTVTETAKNSDEVLTVKLRYKPPQSDKGSWGLEKVIAQAQMGVGSDKEGYRLNFVKMAKQAQLLSRNF